MSQHFDIDKFFINEPRQMIVYGGRLFQEALTKALKESIHYNHYLEPQPIEIKRRDKNPLNTITNINDILKLKPDTICHNQTKLMLLN